MKKLFVMCILFFIAFSAFTESFISYLSIIDIFSQNGTYIKCYDDKDNVKYIYKSNLQLLTVENDKITIVISDKYCYTYELSEIQIKNDAQRNIIISKIK